MQRKKLGIQTDDDPRETNNSSLLPPTTGQSSRPQPKFCLDIDDSSNFPSDAQIRLEEESSPIAPPMVPAVGKKPKNLQLEIDDTPE